MNEEEIDSWYAQEKAEIFRQYQENQDAKNSEVLYKQRALKLRTEYEKRITKLIEINSPNRPREASFSQRIKSIILRK